MRFLVATAVILVTAQAASLGSEKCTWGPSYWCSSIQTASTCQAFTHCVDTVWKHKLLDVQETEICQFSQKLVKTVRRVLDFDNGQDEATHLVASMCTFIRDDDMRKECKDMVSNYLPQILKLMESSLEPSSVAYVLGFCQPHDDRTNETPKGGPYYPPTNATMCNDCRAFISDIRTLINVPGAEDQFSTVIGDIVCSDLGDLTDLCKAFLKVRLPPLYKFLAENDNPEMVCRLGTFCINTVSTKPKWDYLSDVIKGALQADISDDNLEVKEGDIPCSECNKVLSSVTAFGKDSHFRNSVERAIGFLCSHTNLGEEKCQALSEGFISNELVSALSRDLDVQDICTSTLACASAPSEVTPTPQPADEFTPNASFCTDCLRFFGDVRDVLRNNVSVPEATALAKTYLCQQAESFEFPCNDIMEAAMPSILDYLANVDSPPSVCSDLTLCPKPDYSPKFDLVKAFDAAWDRKPLGDFVCDECYDLVQDARDADRNPDVQKAVVDFLNTICDLLGNSSGSQCKALVQQYSPQLFEIIASELEPSVVCDLLLRCYKPGYDEEDDAAVVETAPVEVVLSEELEQSVPVKKSKENSAIYAVQETLQEKVGESVECAICRLAMESIDEVIASNSTEQTIQNSLGVLCDILPSSVKEPCDQFITTYTPALVDLLVQELDPLLICDEIQVCNETLSSFMAPVLRAAEELKKEKKKEKAGDTIECQICELVLGSVDTFIGENRSEAAIQQGLDDICNILPSGIRPQCLSFVNEYASVVVQLLVQELDPQQVCIYIGLCQQNQTVAVPKPTEPSSPVAGPLCSICELVVNQVDSFIGSNRSEVAVQSALDQVCNLFPDTISAECQSFVNAYAPAIINLFVQEIDPQRVCEMLGLCSSSVAEEAGEVAEVPEFKAPAISAGPLCSLCELVVNQLDTLIASNKTEAAVESALDQVCGFFPANVSVQCTNLIRLYAPAIINLLLQETEPQDVCRRLGLCSSSLRVPVALPEVAETMETAAADDLECELCKIVITEINKLIGENRSEAALIEAVEKVCDVVSGDLRLQCKSEVENYGPAVLDLLQHIDDPSEVCKAVKLCASSDDNASGNEEKMPSVSDGEVCIICETLANYAAEAVKEQSTQDEVEKLLKDICTILPNNISSTCITLVEQFTPMILQLVAEKDNPHEVCQDIGLCPKDDTEAQKSVLGVDACTYGPAFWCASTDNAHKCKMVEVCVEKYGMEL